MRLPKQFYFFKPTITCFLLTLTGVLLLCNCAFSQVTSTADSSRKKVNADCNAYITLVLRAYNPVACVGDSIQLVFDWRTAVDHSKFTYQLIINDTVTYTGPDQTLYLKKIKPTDVLKGVVIYQNGCFQQETSDPITGLSFNNLVTSSVSITTSQAGPVCPGSPITYTATPVNGGLVPNYSWQVNGVTVVPYGDSTFTSTTLKDGDKVNCVLTAPRYPCALGKDLPSNSITAQILPEKVPAPAVTISASANNVYKGTYITFTATTLNTGATTTYQWKVNGKNAGANSPTFTTDSLNNNDKVDCVITTNTGCIVFAYSNIVSVYILAPKGVVIPNTFTPNSDGVNDTWKITGLSFYPDIAIKVFNRYGIIVYQSHGYPTPWDGTGSNRRPLPDGVYYYLISLDDKSPQVSGWLAIIR